MVHINHNVGMDNDNDAHTKHSSRLHTGIRGHTDAQLHADVDSQAIT